MRTALHMDAKQQSFSAFTFPDLIAVIAGITLLAVVAAPVMGRSKDNGRGAVCSNNLRQLGMAVNLYAAENRDYLAMPNWDGGNATVAGWLYTGSVPNPETKTNLADAYKSGLWFRYVRTPSTYICPVDRENPMRSQRVNRLASYTMNGAVCNYGQLPPRKVTDARSPDCYLMWEPDSNLGTFVFTDGAAYPAPTATPFEGIGALHSGSGAEILNVGGGIRFVTGMMFRQQASAQVNQVVLW